MTLVDARDGVGLETTYANGSLLTPSMSDPWNAPGVHTQLVASLFDSHSPMKLRLSAIPSMAGWGVRFLANSTAGRHAAAMRSTYLLARYSVARTRELRLKLGLEYDAAANGSMKLFREPRSMKRCVTMAEQLAPLGLRFEVLDRDRTIAVEPALGGIRDRIIGALQYVDDESGDALKFCEALAAEFLQVGGLVRLGVQVKGIAIKRGEAVGIETVDGHVQSDAVIVAAGNTSAALLRGLGIALPIKPVKGYTVTFEDAEIRDGPTVPVVDDALHAAVVPLGKRLRVAGTAEFAGSDLTLRPERIKNLLTVLAGIYPRIAARLESADSRPWAGLRPMSADGLPFIGTTHIKGLYVNGGHGHLGWTLASGSARLLADLVSGGSPSIDPTPYRPMR